MINLNKRKSRLIFVQSYFYPDYSAGSQMLSDLSFYHSNKNFDVSVIASRKMYDGVNKPLLYYEEISDVTVYRVWSSNIGKKRYIGRIIDYISLEITLIIKLFKILKKGDIVVLMTDPPLLNIFAYPLIRLKRGLVVNWLQDVFPEIAVSAGLLTKTSIINYSITKLRNKVLKGADKNIVIGNKMYDYLVDIGVNDKKISKIENWSDGRAIYSIANKDNYIRKDWGLENKFVIGYSGNLGRVHDISTILTVIENFKFDKNILFLFIGGGVGLNKIIKYSKSNKLNNVMFKPYQDRALLALSLNVADVHWVTLDPKMEGFIVPSKYYGILAAGKPVYFIGDSDGELARDIKRIGCGETFEIGDCDKLESVIKQYSDDPKYVTKMGDLGRVEFCKSYDFPVAADKFMKLFNEL
jgi:colanic acid biosynthesis glycosyl transferase WcaI